MRGSDMGDRICSVEGCERASRSASIEWCVMHYKRWWKYGDPTVVMRVRRPAPPTGVCVIPGCGLPHHARGWCDLHYERWRHTGDPLKVRINYLMRPNGMRRCSACKSEKDIDQFCRSAGRHDGLATECRACAKAAYARWAKANPQGPRDIVARRRARKLSLPNEHIDSTVVLERDGWMCGICGEAIDPDLKWPHPTSQSVDHVVPLAAGGAHLYSNVQAAHLGCNISKGARAG